MDWLTLLAVLSLQPVISANAEIALRCWDVRTGIVTGVELFCGCGRERYEKAIDVQMAKD